MRDPDFSGIARAWEIRNDPGLRERHIKEFGYPDAGIATWIVNGPYHPFWSWWHVGVIHLRDMPGCPPANKQYPEAEYEFTIWSLNAGPKFDRKTIDVDELERGTAGSLGFLHPADVTFQFHKVTDEQAAEIGRSAIQHIVAGQSCDSDYRSWWLAALARTVEHHVLGVHE